MTDRIFGDVEVMRFGDGVQTSHWVHEWLRGCREQYGTHGFGPWAVVDKRTKDILGYCGLLFFPDLGGQSEVEIGYRLVRSAWGRGYATEAALAVRNYGFDTLDLSRLVSLIDPRNTASIRVAKKIGMCYERYVMLPGYTHPDRLYVIARLDAASPAVGTAAEA